MPEDGGDIFADAGIWQGNSAGQHAGFGDEEDASVEHDVQLQFEPQGREVGINEMNICSETLWDDRQ